MTTSGPRRQLLRLAVAFLLVRAATLLAYRDTLYYYGMVSNQFAIAEAAYKGHWFAWDKELAGNVMQAAKQQDRFIPLEEWKHFPGSGRYTVFPAQDLPGFGYIVVVTSRWWSDHLTTRYAMAIQLLSELAGLLFFVSCVRALVGARTAWLAGLVYVFGYPFMWPIASQPMRDVFAVPVYAALLAAVVWFAKTRGAIAAYLGSGLLIAAAAALLWVRPYGYYFGVLLLPFAVLVPRRPWRDRLALAVMLVLLPWLAFGLPLRQFNLRHYGVVETEGMGRGQWVRMGIAKDNPYGFVLSDEAMVPWIKRYYGRDVDYGSPEMNRLLGDYAEKILREDPAFYVKTVLLVWLQLAKTPLDVVPPFPLVEYASSGLRPTEYLSTYPGQSIYKALNRILLTVYFYGGILLAIRMLKRRREERWGLAMLLTPLVYTTAVQAATLSEPRYMAVGAWVLVLPIAAWLQELADERRRSRSVVNGLAPNAASAPPS
jgi:hypothetical protein